MSASSQDEPASQKTDIVATEDGDAERLTELLEGVPATQRQAVLEMFSQSESHSGWLPTPKFLAEYEAILPGLAERIVALPEREQAHRHKVVERVVIEEASLKKRGQNFAMASLALLLIVAMLLIALGQYSLGAQVATFGIVGVVGIFVTGKWFDAKAAKTDEVVEE